MKKLFLKLIITSSVFLFSYNLSFSADIEAGKKVFKKAYTGTAVSWEHLGK